MSSAPVWLKDSVSRETMDDLCKFERLVQKWTSKINLISPEEKSRIWNRHIWDSSQLFLLLQKRPLSWIDLGSGGGFPGLVLAVLDKKERNLDLTLVESDARKCVFLRTAVRELKLNATVVQKRIEELPTQRPDYISARALAPLENLLGSTEGLRSPRTISVFPKGKNWQSEVDIASKQWQFDIEIHASKTDPQAAILEITNVERK